MGLQILYARKMVSKLNISNKIGIYYRYFMQNVFQVTFLSVFHIIDHILTHSNKCIVMKFIAQKL